MEVKEERLAAFGRGEIRVLVTKPRIASWGLNYQNCHRMTYFADHSYEAMYQAVRRCWRYGQQHPVTVDVVTTPGGKRVLANLERKAAQADEMFGALVKHMNDALTVARTRDLRKRRGGPVMGQVADQVITENYALYNADAMEAMSDLPDGCMHGVVYSPPFAYGDEGLGGAGLYKYSSQRAGPVQRGRLHGVLRDVRVFRRAAAPADDARPAERRALHGHPDRQLRR